MSLVDNRMIVIETYHTLITQGYDTNSIKQITHKSFIDIMKEIRRKIIKIFILTYNIICCIVLSNR